MLCIWTSLDFGLAGAEILYLPVLYCRSARVVLVYSISNVPLYACVQSFGRGSGRVDPPVVSVCRRDSAPLDTPCTCARLVDLFLQPPVCSACGLTLTTLVLDLPLIVQCPHLHLVGPWIIFTDVKNNQMIILIHHLGLEEEPEVTVEREVK